MDICEMRRKSIVKGVQSASIKKKKKTFQGYFQMMSYILL